MTSLPYTPPLLDLTAYPLYTYAADLFDHLVISSDTVAPWRVWDVYTGDPQRFIWEGGNNSAFIATFVTEGSHAVELAGGGCLTAFSCRVGFIDQADSVVLRAYDGDTLVAEDRVDGASPPFIGQVEWSYYSMPVAVAVPAGFTRIEITGTDPAGWGVDQMQYTIAERALPPEAGRLKIRVPGEPADVWKFFSPNPGENGGIGWGKILTPVGWVKT